MMNGKCQYCKYNHHYCDDHRVCIITNIITDNPKFPAIPCSYDVNMIKDMNICFNCEHWIGAGDWGLSCRQHYHATSNGFDEACVDFKRSTNGY